MMLSNGIQCYMQLHIKHVPDRKFTNKDLLVRFSCIQCCFPLTSIKLTDGIPVYMYLQMYQFEIQSQFMMKNRVILQSSLSNCKRLKYACSCVHVRPSFRNYFDRRLIFYSQIVYCHNFATKSILEGDILRDETILK